MSAAMDSWAAQLGFLRADVAAGVEPMARRLGLVMGLDPAAPAEAGEVDGYDGLASRGPIDRMLTSEWLLASEEPDEFIRRVAVDELSYLRLARTSPRPPGRITVLVDAGPDEIGAPRLVQLAGLVVLARVAARHRVPLAIGVVGEPVGSWREGELPDLFAGWLAARRSERADADEVAEWLAAEPAERSWYFGRGDAAAVASSCGARLLQTVDQVFGPDGIERVEAEADGRRVELVLPPSAAAIALLRGRGLRRVDNEHPSTEVGPAGSLRWPSFSSSAPQGLCRTEYPAVLAAFSASGAGGRVRRRAFRGSVLAAGTVGTRTVALVLEGDAVILRIVGKNLADLDGLAVHRTVLGLDDDAVETMVEGPLRPVHFHGGGLYVELPTGWWLLRAGTQPKPEPRLVAVSASRTNDMARLAHRAHDDPDQLVIDYEARPDWAGGTCCFGPASTAAYPVAEGDGGRRWAIVRGRIDRWFVEPKGEPIGICFDAGQPALVVRSDGGHLIRVVSWGRTRTLTAASGGIVHASMHPTLPLLVVQRDDGEIHVVTTDTGDVRQHVRWDAR
ncbi:MAG: hypothetical protein ACTHN0_18535 [Aquihabitans sp.]